VFSQQQESCRKDVERVFAVLENKFQILQRAFRLHSSLEINSIVLSCIILHNMMVEQRIAQDGEVYFKEIINEQQSDNCTTIFPTRTEEEMYNVQQYESLSYRKI
jgi:Plant transposon protein